MSGFVIIVDFKLKPGSLPAFRTLIDENATASCAKEPGCRRFDVIEPPDETDRVVLYEIYDDQAAFEAHIRTGHFASFDAASKAHVTDKIVNKYNLVCEGSAAAAARRTKKGDKNG